MGSTFIAFREKGFEADDSALEVWLILIVREIDKMDSVPEWLKEVRDEWHLQATAGFGFGVMPDLDRFAASDGHRGTLLGLCRLAEKELQRFGGVISRDALNALQTGGEGAIFTKDVPAEMFLRTGRYFMKLLEGELSPSEADARFEPDVSR